MINCLIRNICKIHEKVNLRCLSINATNTLHSITKTVHPHSIIKSVDFPYNLKIKPFDLLDCPDVNQLRLSFISKNNISDFLERYGQKLSIHVSDKDVQLIATGGVEADEWDQFIDYILLEVPVQSDIDVSCTKNVWVEKLYSDLLKLHVAGDIVTKNINGFDFQFESYAGGNINCQGLTLANKINIRARENGNITLDKAQGDLMYAICDSGTLTTNSCYAESSKFVSQNGFLKLHNVHKTTEAYLLEGGKLEMLGFHGQMQVKTNGGDLSFQLTEVYGDSIIEARDPDSLAVNISEFVEDHTLIEVNAKEIILQPKLQHLSGDLMESGVKMIHGNEDLNDNKLTITTNGSLTMDKMSWMDTIKNKLENK